MREVADMHIIKDDFVLVRGDIITNINIQDALKMHYHIKQEEAKKENQTTDTRKWHTIMTKLFLRMAHSNPKRDPTTDITLLLDRQTKEILKYQSIVQENKKQIKHIKINDEYLPVAKSFADQGESIPDIRVNNKYPNGGSIELR